MPIQRRTLLGSAVASVLGAGVLPTVEAAESDGPITVFHPFEPSPYDALSHVINDELSKETGRQVLFE